MPPWTVMTVKSSRGTASRQYRHPREPNHHRIFLRHFSSCRNICRTQTLGSRCLPRNSLIPSPLVTGCLILFNSQTGISACANILRPLSVPIRGQLYVYQNKLLSHITFISTGFLPAFRQQYMVLHNVNKPPTPGTLHIASCDPARLE